MTTCAIEGCEAPARVRGWCTKHYQRWRAHGDPEAILTGRGRPLIERLMARVEVREDGCWVWTGGTNDGGYGRFAIAHDHNVAPHRWSYEYHVGPIPEGLTIDHLCRVRLCVNPAHLEAVTLRENLLRGDTPAARNAAKTHCLRGHPYDDANTYVYRGMRSCRACRRISD